jgi:hypothetical protein
MLPPCISLEPRAIALAPTHIASPHAEKIAGTLATIATNPSTNRAERTLRVEFIMPIYYQKIVRLYAIVKIHGRNR